MTVQEFLRTAVATLAQAGVPSARLDCLILLEDALGLDRAKILAHPETLIDPVQLARLNKKIAQRTDHLPLAYIRGRAPFFDRIFTVNKHVLVPRPETETMVEMLLQLPLPASPRLADVGTGSGCIGITAAIELPGAKVELYDIDDEALKLAAKNARIHEVSVKVVKSDLLEKLSEADAILANLPYVPERYAINQAAKHEPKHAIFSGKDGLNLYRRFWEQIAQLSERPRFVLTEALPPQHDDVVVLAKAAGYQLRQAQDFIQVFERAT